MSPVGISIFAAYFCLFVVQYVPGNVGHFLPFFVVFSLSIKSFWILALFLEEITQFSEIRSKKKQIFFSPYKRLLYAPPGLRPTSRVGEV